MCASVGLCLVIPHAPCTYTQSENGVMMMSCCSSVLSVRTCLCMCLCMQDEDELVKNALSAYDFAAKDIDGETINLSKYK